MGLDGIDFRPRDPLRAADLQAMLEAIRRPDWDVRSGPGIDVRKGTGGQIQLAAIASRGYVGTASGDISPRSGTAWGTGVVTLSGFDGTHEYSLSIDLDVLNPSSNTMTGGAGIADGSRCFVDRTEQGWWIVSPLECS